MECLLDTIEDNTLDLGPDRVRLNVGNRRRNAAFVDVHLLFKSLLEDVVGTGVVGLDGSSGSSDIGALGLGLRDDLVELVDGLVEFGGLLGGRSGDLSGTGFDGLDLVGIVVGSAPRSNGRLALGLLGDPRRVEDVVPLEVLVADQNTTDPRNVEEPRPESQEGSTTETAKDASHELPLGHRLGLGQVRRALEDDVLEHDTESDKHVDREHLETALERVGRLEHDVLDGEVDEGSKDTREDGRSDPRDGDLGKAVPAPVDGAPAGGSDGDTDDTADDGVGGRDGETEVGGDKNGGRRADLCA